MPLKSEIAPVTRCFSRRCSAVFCFLPASHQGLCGVGSSELRTISLFICSSACEMSSLTCSTFRLFIISLIFGSGPRSLRAIASLNETALPITLRLDPHDRQYCTPEEDSVPHCGQYICFSDLRRALSCCLRHCESQLNYDSEVCFVQLSFLLSSVFC